jgi:hypothetical protein
MITIIAKDSNKIILKESCQSFGEDWSEQYMRFFFGSLYSLDILSENISRRRYNIKSISVADKKIKEFFTHESFYEEIFVDILKYMKTHKIKYIDMFFERS